MSERRPTSRTIVPCGTCKACCKRELLFLHPEMGDNLQDYRCHPAINPVTGHAGYALDHNANGDCIYLGEQGCTIWDRAPAICREFDCRDLYKRRRKIARSLNTQSFNDLQPVMRAGKARLKAQRGMR